MVTKKALYAVILDLCKRLDNIEERLIHLEVGAKSKTEKKCKEKPAVKRGRGRPKKNA